MNFNRPLASKLIREILGRKMALASLIVIVTIGVGSYVGMASVFRDLDGARARYYSEYRLADFIVDLKRAPEWAIDEVTALPNVRAARGRVNMGVLIDLDEVDLPITGTAISMPLDRRPVLDDVQLRRGAWFSGRNDREVILNDSFAEANGLKPGDRIKVLLLDRQHELLIVGTAMSPEFVYLLPAGGGLAPDPARFGVLYMTENFLRRSCDLEGAWNQVIGLTHKTDPTSLRNTLTLIEERLDSYGVTLTTPAFEQPSVQFLHDELLGLKVSSTITPLIFLGVGALILNVIISRMVVKERTVIGTLKALGYSSWSVMRHYLMFGALVGSIGGVTGMFMGFSIEMGLISVYRGIYSLPSIDPHFYPDILVIGFSISVVFAVLGTVGAVRRAARLSPAEAMRPPAPEKGGRILLERLDVFWNALPFRWKMILRNIFRNPYRSLVSAFASFIATALIVMTLSMTDALDYLMKYQFEKITHEDLTVSLRDPVGRRSAAEFGETPGVAMIEEQLGVACDLINGPHRKRLGIQGLPKNNRLFTPLDANGNAVPIPEEGLILTKKLAEILHAKPGDTIRVRPLIAQRKEAVAPVIAVVDAYLGLTAYADIEYLSRLLGEDRSSNTLLAYTFRGSKNGELMDEIRKRPTVIGIGERTRSLEQIAATFGESMGVMLGVMVMFAGMIAFGSVLNTALVSLSERRRDVGSLRVLGYTTPQVSGIFSGESFLLNGLGILFGLAGGIALTRALSLAYDTELYRFPAVTPPIRLLQAAIIMVVFIGLAQAIIYWLIRGLDWLEVLKIKE